VSVFTRWVLVGALVLGACGADAATTTSSTTSEALATTVTSTTVETSSTTTTTALPPTTTLPPPAVWRAVASGELSILFVGNSHTSTNDIPGTVESLLASLSDHDPTVETLKAGFLRMAMDRPDITEEVSSGDWDIVILQGHEISMSQSTRYSQKEPVALARLALDAGSRALFFSEWKREGVEETKYIESLYREMAAKAGAEVVPIGRSWDHFLSDHPDHELWNKDGNHSSPDGAYLAAAAIVYYLVGPDADLTAAPDQAPFLGPARSAIAEYLDE